MTPSKPAKVLVIDDDVTQRLLVKEYLEAAGYIVRLADDGRKGLSLAANTQPNIILLDLLLPSLDGYTVCTALKESPATAHIPVLLITGSRESNVIERGLSAGASDFITKPVDWDFLADRVEHVLRSSKSPGQRTGANPATASIAAAPAQPIRDDADTNKALASANQKIKELTEELAQASRRSEEAARLRTAHDIQRIEREWAAKLQSAEMAAATREKSIEERIQQETKVVWQLMGIAAARQIEGLGSIQKRINGLALCDAPTDLVERAPATLAQVTGLVSKLHTAETNLRALALHTAQTAPVKESAVDVGAMLADLANDATLFGARGDVSIGCQCEPDLWLSADQNALRMALACLFENAIKFSPPNGFIQLEGHCLPNESVSLRISDNGFGILPAQLDRLRACVESSNLSALTSTGRVGTGLLLARAIAALHNGRITIESGQDSGTRVTLILPPERRIAKPDSAKQRLAAAVRRLSASGSA